MQIFKFGGASIADSSRIAKVSNIIKAKATPKTILVVSAIANVTNELEKITFAYFHKEENLFALFDQLKQKHLEVCADLFDSTHPVFDELNDKMVELEWFLEDENQDDYNYCYDQIVSLGEIFSTTIIHHYLGTQGLANIWLDARDIIRTDNNYRNASIDWDITKSNINKATEKYFARENLIVTQGFIGGSSENFNTTLGREGSDFTASIFAHCAKAEKITVWKDVQGIMTADPKLFPDASYIEKISYSEILEMADAGAKVLHPKTMRPLEVFNIPLQVKSFINPEFEGTLISKNGPSQYPPLIMLKENQVYIYLSPKSFDQKLRLELIFTIFSSFNTRINFIHRAAVNTYLCFEQNDRFEEIITSLSSHFIHEVKRGLTLVHIRHPEDETVQRICGAREKIIEIKTPNAYKCILGN